MGEFNAHIGTDTNTRKGVIGKLHVLGLYPLMGLDLMGTEGIYCSFVVATNSAS